MKTVPSRLMLRQQSQRPQTQLKQQKRLHLLPLTPSPYQEMPTGLDHSQEIEMELELHLDSSENHQHLARLSMLEICSSM